MDYQLESLSKITNIFFLINSEMETPELFANILKKFIFKEIKLKTICAEELNNLRRPINLLGSEEQ